MWHWPWFPNRYSPQGHETTVFAKDHVTELDGSARGTHKGISLRLSASYLIASFLYPIRFPKDCEMVGGKNTEKANEEKSADSLKSTFFPCNLEILYIIGSIVIHLALSGKKIWGMQLKYLIQQPIFCFFICSFIFVFNSSELASYK